MTRDPMPASSETERAILGLILLDHGAYGGAVPSLAIDDFSTETHRRIYRRIADLHTRGEQVDYISVFTELQRKGEAESVGGLSCLTALTDGLPLVPAIDSYVKILHGKSALRRILHGCAHFTALATSGEPAEEIILAARELFDSISSRDTTRYRSITELPSLHEAGAGDLEWIRKPELFRAGLVGLTGDSGQGKSTVATAWLRDALRKNGIPGLLLDKENPLAVVRDRLQRLSIEDGPDFRVWGGWLQEETPQPDAPIVLDWVRSREPRPLIVVDSLSAFHGGDQNDAGETRRFMHRCRRLADLGASVVILHHTGKSETSKDYRGSSDFKASLDLGFHVTNFGNGALDKLLLRPFKTRVQVEGELLYDYAGGRLLRSEPAEARQTVDEQLTVLLRLNPRITARNFEGFAIARGIGRLKAREFLGAGVLAGSIRRETGARNVKRHSLIEAKNAE